MAEKKQGPARARTAVKLASPVAPQSAPPSARIDFAPEPPVIETKVPFMPEPQTSDSAPTQPIETVVTAAIAPAWEPIEIAPPELSVPELPVTEPQPTTVATLAPGHEGSNDMATVLDTPTFSTDKAQAMFGGLNDKAKTALAKTTKIGEELTELTKGNVEAIVESTKLAAKGAETMGAEAVATGKKSMESAMTAFKGMAAVKSPTELFQLQSDFAKSSFDTAIADASKFSESWMKLAGEIFQPLSNRYAIAAEKMKAAAL